MPSRLLVLGTYQHVREAVAHCIYALLQVGGYYFDMGGETYAGIDIERLNMRSSMQRR